MKTILTCVAVMFFLTCCEEEWGDEAEMSYVVAINDNGTCAYDFSEKVGGPKKKSITLSCGHYKIGEGIFTDQDWQISE